MREVMQTVFDYDTLDTETTTYLKQSAQETRVLLKRTAEDIIKIGQNLLEAKKRLPHGQYISWVQTELGISQPTAWRFMQAVQGKEIKKKSFTVNDLVEQISAPSPEVETAIQRSHQHAGITYRPEKEAYPFEVEIMDWDEGELKRLGCFSTLKVALEVRDTYVRHHWDTMSCAMQYEYAIARPPFSYDVFHEGVPPNLFIPTTTPSRGFLMTSVGLQFGELQEKAQEDE